ncbi:MAG: hypothetical protein JWP52_319, partial [Rhizobacter sp.]|nr:hypothetical protein [Rhizobacter sp.]
EDFSQPAGEPALVSHDSVSWQVFRNPLSVLVGGIAAVVLELAEPRVRTGVFEHSSFKADPMSRLHRTGRATMVTVYGPHSRAEAMIARVGRIHRPLQGVTPNGLPYRATDPELLTWVHATASYGFLQARHVYVNAISHSEQDRFLREGQRSAALYGAAHAPASRAELQRLFDAKKESLEPSLLLREFLHVMQTLPLLPRAFAPMQRLLVRAAVQLVPEEVRGRLALNEDWRVRPWEAALLRTLARSLDRLPLRSSPPVQACRRLGLPDDYLCDRAS